MRELVEGCVFCNETTLNLHISDQPIFAINLNSPYITMASPNKIYLGSFLRTYSNLFLCYLVLIRKALFASLQTLDKHGKVN